MSHGGAEGGGGSGECAARPHGNAAGPGPAGLPRPLAPTLRGSARSRRRPGSPPGSPQSCVSSPGPGAAAADMTVLARAGPPGPAPPASRVPVRGRALPARRSGRSQPSVVLPRVPTSERLPSGRRRVPALGPEFRSDFAPLLLSDAWGFGHRSSALTCSRWPRGHLAFLGPAELREALGERKPLVVLPFLLLVIVLVTSLSTYTQHCIAHSSPKRLSVALLGVSHTQLTADTGKHWLSAEQRLFGVSVCLSQCVFSQPSPTLACPLTVFTARVRKQVLDGLPDTRVTTKRQNWTRSLRLSGALFGRFVEVLGCSSRRQK